MSSDRHMDMSAILLFLFICFQMDHYDQYNRHAKICLAVQCSLRVLQVLTDFALSLILPMLSFFFCTFCNFKALTFFFPFFLTDMIHLWLRYESYMTHVWAMSEIWTKPVRAIHETGKDFEWSMNEWSKNTQNVFEYTSNTFL